MYSGDILSSCKFSPVTLFCKLTELGQPGVSGSLCFHIHSYCSHKAILSWNLYLLTDLVSKPRDSHWDLFYSRCLDVRSFKLFNWIYFWIAFLWLIWHAAITTSMAWLDFFFVCFYFFTCQKCMDMPQVSESAVRKIRKPVHPKV